MTNTLSRFWQRVFGGNVSEKSSLVWTGSTVTPGEASQGMYSQAPGKVFTGRATQYVLICAMLVARVCASQRLRLYAPARAGGGKRLDAKTVRGRKRLDRLKSARAVGKKSAEYGEYAGDIQEIMDHPVLDLLHKPNPWQTGNEFNEQAFAYKNLAGNAYVNAYFDDAVPELYHLAPQFVTILPDPAAFVRGYAYARNASKPVVFAPEDVLHLKHSAPVLSPYYGVGPLQAVLLEADLAAAATQAEVYRWLNGGRPDFVVKVDPATSPEQRAQIKAEIKRETQGVKKSGRFMVLQNSEILPLGFRPKDMEYLNGLTRSDELIWNAFGVPQSELKMNDANYASASTGNVQFLGRTIAPQCNRHADDLNEWLLPKFDVEPGAMWLCYDEIVPEDEIKEAEMDRADVGAGILTLDEARANRGLEPHEGGVGAIPRVNGQVIGGAADQPDVIDTTAQDVPEQAALPAGAATDVQATAMNGSQVAALAGLVSQVADGTIPLESARALAAAACPALTAEQVGAIFTPLVGFEAEKPEPAVPFGQAPSDAADPPEKPEPEDKPEPPEPKSLGKGLAFYGHQCHHKAAPITDAPRGTIGNIDAFAGRLEEWFKREVLAAIDKRPIGGVLSIPGGELQKIIDEELKRLFTFAAAAGAREVGQSLDVAPASAIEFLSTYKVRLAQSITEDLASSLNTAIRGGLEAGDSYDQIAARITMEAPEIAGWRAERIARTETSNALTEGRIFAWEDLGVARKQWVLSGNPCEVCQAIADTYAGPIPMGQAFVRLGETVPGTTYTADWRPINGPPLHPACVVPDSKIAGVGFEAMTKTRYSGEVVEITLESGARITVTPNHEVLGANGFVAAKSVREGDDLVYHPDFQRVAGGIDPDNDNGPPTAEEVFDSLVVARGVPSVRVPVSAEDFHGDGRGMDGDVQVVSINRKLRSGRKPSGGQPFIEELLRSGGLAAELIGGGDLGAVFAALRYAADGGVGGTRNPLSLFRATQARYQLASLGESAMTVAALIHAAHDRGPINPGVQGDIEYRFSGDMASIEVVPIQVGADQLAACAVAERGQATDDGLQTDTKRLRDGLARLPAIAALSKVVSVKSRNFEGHVYDLQAETGLYTCNGVYSSNCACGLLPIL